MTTRGPVKPLPTPVPIDLRLTTLEADSRKLYRIVDAFGERIHEMEKRIVTLSDGVCHLETRFNARPERGVTYQRIQQHDERLDELSAQAAQYGSAQAKQQETIDKWSVFLDQFYTNSKSQHNWMANVTRRVERIEAILRGDETVKQLQPYTALVAGGQGRSGKDVVMLAFAVAVMAVVAAAAMLLVEIFG